MIPPIPENAVDRLKHEGHLLLRLPASAGNNVINLFEAARTFFRSPADEKEASKLASECGYRPYGIEYSQSPERPDRMESFTVSIRNTAHKAGFESGRAALLYSRMVEVFAVFELVVEHIARKVARELTGIDRPELQGAFRNWSRLQLNYSRPTAVKEHFINELHEDGDFLTVACADKPGLEIVLQSGAIAPITASPPDVLLMPGEIIWLLSGGSIPRLYHQVRPAPEVRERMSLLLFSDLDPHLCQPWLRNSVNSQVDVSARVRASVKRFGLSGFETD